MKTEPPALEVIMRVASLFCLVLIGASFVSGQQQTIDTSQTARNDPYSVAFVSSALNFFKRAFKEGASSFEVKQFSNRSPFLPQLGDGASLPELGDGVSIAVLKIYNRDELVKFDNLNAYLAVVCLAFSNRSWVLEKSDLDPKVTSFVLDYLQEKEVSSPTIEKRIAYLKQCIRDYTCSPQGECDFSKKP